MSDLHSAVTEHMLLKDKLLAAFPELAEDDTALADTLEGVSNLNDALLAVFDSAEEDKASMEAIEMRIADLDARKSRYKARVEGKRRLIAQAMEQASLTSVVGPTATLSLRRLAPSVVITDEESIPTEFWREKVTKSVDKVALKEALGKGDVLGATMSNGGVSLSGRVR